MSTVITKQEPLSTETGRASPSPQRARRRVVLGVTASDAHAVANQLIAQHLRSNGFAVTNLGPCTSVADFVRTVQNAPSTEALLIGSLNGHAYDDLRSLSAARSAGLVGCPVILGGNLSVGALKRSADVERLYSLGVDFVLDNAEQLIPLLDRLSRARSSAAPASVPQPPSAQAA